MNAAVIGYSLHQELLTLRQHGIALRPDLVIVGFAMNDAYPTEDPFYNVHKFYQPVKKNVRRRRYQESPKVRFYFYTFVRSLARMVKNRLLSNNTYSLRAWDNWPPSSFEAQAWPVMQEDFKAMKRLANGHNFRLLVLILPTLGSIQFVSDSELPQVRLRAFLDSEQIDYLDLMDTFRGREREMFRDTMHLTKLGHQLTAETILRQIQTGL